MKTVRKALLLTLCAALLVGAAVMGTLAYLTSQDSVINTFTVGNVKITLDEADVKTDGTYEVDKNTRVDSNVYKLIPGHSYIKDPIVHVAAGSEDCWLFVEVENGIAAIEADTTIAAQMTAKGWALVAGTQNVYSYKATAKAGENVPVFDTFTVAGDADVSNYTEAQIVVTAYAVQADGFNTAAAAWAAAGFDKTTGQ